jgi:hypothetical protein
MATETQLGITGLHLVGLENLRKRWGWFLALGILLVVLGMVALGSSVFMTLATMVFVGWLLIVGGVLEAAHACSCKGWGGFFHRPADRHLVRRGRLYGRGEPWSHGSRPDAADRHVSDFRRHLPHRGSCRGPFPELGLAAAARCREPAVGDRHLAAVATVGPVGDRAVRRDRHAPQRLVPGHAGLGGEEPADE